ncbi:sulfatase [Bythopirellula polymerisocia]|uniref:Arylsulfatase n=1 Tax=Bythopirellula polymerisocia TaxID=2528003 RepID=A0A5C6CUK5_9BACT|nr:sulfatase [Bythopirellula polymerisocia]TWU28653.1 Arylsulfatase [Bythopirellula polymerisocia]
MKYLSWLWVGCAFVANLTDSVTAQEVSRNERPNVLFILADDLGWRDLGNEGSSLYETPNIDRIASEGMKFTRGYSTCQVCSPSRASVMTGKYPARLDITDWIGALEGEAWGKKNNAKLLPPTYNHALPAEETTIAEAFRDHEYRTFFAGKWHLGGKGSLPTDHGFEINIGGNHSGSPPGGFFSPWNNPQMKDGPRGEYLPLRLGRETASFIETHKGEPFFAFLSFYAVHAPVQTTQVLWKKYRDKAVNAGAVPERRFIVDRLAPVRQVQDHPLYAGLVETMDEAVGIVLSKLDKLRLTENTIIVFTSDNGGVSAGDNKATSNLPLRGGKGRQWEGGIRVPYYIVWPEKITSGLTCDVPVTGTDFYPTLLELTGLECQADQHLDGVSLVPLLSGRSIEDRNLYWHYPHYGNQGGEPSSIVISGDWKLIHYYEDGRDELYNLAQDIGEQSNALTNHLDKARELKVDLDRWLENAGARMPTVNPNFDKAKYERQQIHTRQVEILKLEREHAGFLKKDYSPSGGWWEDTGR